MTHDIRAWDSICLDYDENDWACLDIVLYYEKLGNGNYQKMKIKC